MSGDHRHADQRGNRLFLKSTGVDRHLGLVCLCPLIDCCHNEDTDEGDRWRCMPDDFACGTGMHAHSGSPVSGYTQPWEPGDDSWRGDAQLAALARRVTKAGPVREWRIQSVIARDS